MFKRQLIQLVVKNGVPLSLFARPAFTALNGEMAHKLGVSLDRESIRKLVIEEARKEKENLKKTLKSRFMFLKMDSCIHHRVNYFAINVRYVCDNKEIVTKTLAVKDSKPHHTSQFLQTLVENVLQDYELKKEQVLAIVTDNASNISTIKLMNASNEQQLEENLGFSMCEMEGHSAVHVTEAQTDITTEEQQNDTLGLDDLVVAASKHFHIHHMRCVVHTLQLAIRESLQEGHTGNLIGKVRKLVIAARTPKIDSILKRRAGKGAIVDQATQWGSTYLMIERLLELKPFLIDIANPQVTLNEGQWTQLAELKKLLNHPFTVTKKLQAEDLTPGIFIREWKKLLFCLSQRGGLIADAISASMKRRERQLLENKILLAAVYVDPSHRILLDDQQLTKGKEALTEIAVRMSGLQDCQAQEDLGPDSATAAISSSSSNEEFNFDKYLDDMEQAKRCRKEKDFTPSPVTSRLTRFHQNFSLAFKEIEKFNRSSKLTVHEAIPLYPEIVRDVAHVVTALPSTQVTVEKLFSSLKITRSDLRSSMKEDLMEAILFLTTNS
ncbi:uncharacterized protein ACNLHF_008128 [Anomaloglossus baeobatrachus]